MQLKQSKRKNVKLRLGISGPSGFGKTHSAFSITNFQGRAFHNVDNGSLKKSVNLEWDYFIFQSNIEEYLIRTSSQIFIMPGQKGRAKLGEGLAFEDAADLYFHVAPIKIVVALILTYDLTDIRTFQELEYWLNRAIERDMIQSHTSLILLGTHLDNEEDIMVSDDNVDDAKDFVRDLVLDKIGIDLGNNKIHSVKCSHVKEEYFQEKVIDGGCKNGNYYLIDDIEGVMRSRNAKLCMKCMEERGNDT